MQWTSKAKRNVNMCFSGKEGTRRAGIRKRGSKVEVSSLSAVDSTYMVFYIHASDSHVQARCIAAFARST